MHAGEGANFILHSGSYRPRSVLASDSPPSCRDFPVHLNYCAAVMGNNLFLCLPLPPPGFLHTHTQRYMLAHMHICMCKYMLTHKAGLVSVALKQKDSVTYQKRKPGKQL